jgi:hypothetical protein
MSNADTLDSFHSDNDKDFKVSLLTLRTFLELAVGIIKHLDLSQGKLE